MSDLVYPEWLDLVWVAVDSRGRLAALITAGQGPIAQAALPTLDVVGAWLDDLPDRCGASPADAHEAFASYARKGVFVFDWSDVHRVGGLLDAYELMAAPEAPITTTDIPAGIAAAIRLTTLDLDFAVRQTIDPRPLTPCLEHPED